jgi:hypothetical protein
MRINNSYKNYNFIFLFSVKIESSESLNEPFTQQQNPHHQSHFSTNNLLNTSDSELIALDSDSNIVLNRKNNTEFYQNNNNLNEHKKSINCNSYNSKKNNKNSKLSESMSDIVIKGPSLNLEINKNNNNNNIDNDVSILLDNYNNKIHISNKRPVSEMLTSNLDEDQDLNSNMLFSPSSSNESTSLTTNNGISLMPTSSPTSNNNNNNSIELNSQMCANCAVCGDRATGNIE